MTSMQATGLQVSRYDGLDALPENYAVLFAQAASRSFFLSRAWFACFETHVLGAARRARVYGVERRREDGSAVPLAALLMTHARRNDEWLRPRRVETLANYYTPWFDLVLADDDARNVAVPALAEALREDRRDWDLLDLQPLDDRASAQFAEALRAAGMPVQPYFCFGNWYLEVAGRTFDQYLSGLSSVLRKNIPYATRRLQRTPGSRLQIVTAPDDVDGAMTHYEKIYQSSWKIPEPYPGFIRAIARSAAERGQLRLGLAFVEDQPAAAQIWFVADGTASIFKIAYDERFARLSVGTVLTAHLMRHALDADRVDCVDYLSGDDEYKKNWMSHRRERRGLLAFNTRSPRGLLHAARHIVGPRARRFFMRRPALPRAEP